MPSKTPAPLESCAADLLDIGGEALRYGPAPMTTDAADRLRARISGKSEDALGRLAQELLESPFISGAISRAFEAREKAAQAQEVAMGALNLPSAGDLERLTRRVRSVSQRLEGVEDALDRIDERVGAIGGAGAGAGALEQRLAAIEGQLTAFAGQLAELASQLAAQPAAAAEAAPSTAAPADAEAELVASVFDTPDVGGAEVRVAPRAGRRTRAREAAARKRAATRRRRA